MLTMNLYSSNDMLGYRTGLAIFSIVALVTTGCDTMVAIPAGPSNVAVSLADDVQPILTARCTGCHIEGGLANLSGSNLFLDEGNVIATGVNQSSTQVNALTLIVPGDADASYLFEKVSQSNPTSGSRMPTFGASLTSEELGLLRDWINQGANDN